MTVKRKSIDGQLYLHRGRAELKGLTVDAQTAGDSKPVGLSKPADAEGNFTIPLPRGKANVVKDDEAVYFVIKKGDEQLRSTESSVTWRPAEGDRRVLIELTLDLLIPRVISCEVPQLDSRIRERVPAVVLRPRF